MDRETQKRESPPYIGFATFASFIKGLSKTGIPSRIDKSLLRNMSGSNQSALLAALRWFSLVDEAGNHGKELEELVAAGEDFGAVLKELLPKAYKFMADGSIQLERATGSQLEEKFRAFGVSGATIVKAMAFFLSACKEAGIPVSAHVKLPKIVKGASPSRGKKEKQRSADSPLNGELDDDEIGDAPASEAGTLRFEIPIPINRKVKISIPSDFTDADWTLLQTMFNAYVTHWKAMQADGGSK